MPGRIIETYLVSAPSSRARNRRLRGAIDVQTAFSIKNVSYSVSIITPPPHLGGGGPYSVVSVSFDIFNQGPNHIAGIFVTTDSWFTWQVVHASFVQFIADDGENWSVSFNSGEIPSFEFVVFCDDLGGVESVPRIWNTNGGSAFQQP
jgi:hypothetical protein